VLDYAKVREPIRTQVDIPPFMESILEPMIPRAAELGVELHGEGPACRASIDPHRFTRVMENLIENALDATVDMKGEIHVSWAPVTGGTQLRVKDHGRGIPKKVLKRIYEPFFSYGKKKGTGLGMATVKKIIEEHGGSMEIISEEGVGTEVILTLPDHCHPPSVFEPEASTGNHPALRMEES
jgi:signal transduction histidine kinase